MLKRVKLHASGVVIMKKQFLRSDVEKILLVPAGLLYISALVKQH